MEDLLEIIIRNYSVIHKKRGDNIGIPLLVKNKKTLYLVKYQSGLFYFTKEDKLVRGIDGCFGEYEILDAACRLNECFTDIHKKLSYFNEISNLFKKCS